MWIVKSSTNGGAEAAAGMGNRERYCMEAQEAVLAIGQREREIARIGHSENKRSQIQQIGWLLASPGRPSRQLFGA